MALGGVGGDGALRKSRDDQVQGLRALDRGDIARREHTRQVGRHEAVDVDMANVRQLEAPILDRAQGGLETEAQQDDVDLEVFLFAGFVVVYSRARHHVFLARYSLELPEGAHGYTGVPDG